MWKKLRAIGLSCLEIGLDLSLLILFSIQAFAVGCLLIYGHLTVPTDWINQLLKEQKVEGYYLQAESFRLQLNGEIQLTKLEVYNEAANEPILEAESTALRYQLFSNGALFTPTEFVLSNGTLQMPAIYSPDGKRTAILEHIAFHLTPRKDLIQVDSFAARHADIRLRGSIDWPLNPSTNSTPPPSLKDIYTFVATALKEKERFTPFIQPTIEFSLAARKDQSIDVSAHLSCEDLKHPQVTGSYFDLQGTFKLIDGEFVPKSALMLRAKDINVPAFDFSGKEIAIQILEDQWAGLLNGVWPEFEISAYLLSTHGVELKSSSLQLSPANYPELQFSGYTSGLKGGIAFSGEMNSETKSGQINANGSVDLFTLIPTDTLATLPQIEFESPPYYELSLTLDEGFKLDHARFRINANQVTANGLSFNYFEAEGDYLEDTFQLSQIYIDRDNQWASGTLSFNHLTHDFTSTLLGSVLPAQYGPVLPSWWDKVFEDIDFNPSHPGDGDFVINGNASPNGEVFFFGSGKVQKVAYKKAYIDEGQLIVRGRGNYVELHNIDAKTGEGWAKGDIGFTSGKHPEHGLLSIRYEFDSLMPLDVASKIFGHTVTSILNDFEVAKLPRVKLTGVTFDQAYTRYANDNNLDLEADIRTPISFKKTPLEHLHFKLHSRNTGIFLRDLQYGYAEGNGSAEVDIYDTAEHSNHLRINLTLNDANQAKAIENLPSFDKIKSHLSKAETKEKEESIGSTGILNLSLQVEGPLDDLYAYNGYGGFVTDNDDLGAIQLLGPLSRLLQDTPLNFTSFNLNRMTAAFKVKQTMIDFSELIIEGPLTKISSTGTYHIPDQALDLRLRVNLFANIGDPESTINTLRKLITSPLPNLLIFDVTGTLQDQKIRSSYDPRNLIPGL
jgi:hypothetical protein